MQSAAPPGVPTQPTPLARAGRSAAARLSDGLGEARRSWRVIVQATVAATLAYAAAQALGHDTPFFAPIAAIATVAISLADRLRRASELLVGNAIGILFADLLVAEIGTGAWQVGLVVAIALTTAILAGGGPILIMQSTSAAILIATLTPPTPDQPWNTGRFVDALVGGGIGLAVSALLMPVDPARHARAATDPVIATLADGYRRVGAALAARDVTAAQAALADLRATAPVLATFHAGLDATRESVRLAPWYWGQRALLADYALAAVHLDNALRNLRVLARQATLALDRGEAVPRSIPAALADLAEAAAGLGPALAGESDAAGVRAALLSAVARTASASAEADPRHGPGLFDAPLVAQVRMSAADLLQATGVSSDEAHAAIRAHGDTARP
jgi:uncharacterized membrane protein YgaE (UPF0421/DUF939 family)